MKPELLSFIQQIPLDTLIVIEGNSELVRNGDVHFPFRQSSDVLYLTGLDVPDIKLTIYNSEVIIWRYPITDKEILWWHNKIGDDEIKHISGISDIRNIELFDVYYTEHSNFILYPEKVIEILHSLRIIKNPSEIKKIKTAIEITQKAFDHIAWFIKTEMYEYEIEAEIARIFRSHHMTEAYPTIVASGPNACILHYTKHTRQIREWDMILIDAGAEYMWYASDMTRTLSVWSGFSHRQQEVYDAVSCIKKIAESNLRPGVVFSEYEKNIREAMNQELVHLGLIPADATEIEKNELSRKYYPHRTSHFLGLDVHDVGDRDIVLQEWMVLTIEPGIYIREESIWIRLEDDYIITSEGCECLG
jgi:Xaa-Pro aminopeptidase